MRRTLYWKRLLIVAAAALVLSGGVFAVHRFQASNQSSVILAQAAKAAAAAETDPAQRGEAIKKYKQYLKFRPNDEAAFQKYATLLLDEAKAAPAPASVATAADGAEAFLRAFPKHPPERQRLAELYVTTGQFSKLGLAKQHLEILFDAPEGNYRENLDVLEMAAVCERGQGNLPGAIVHLEAAIKTGKAPVRLYALAMHLHYANKEDAKREGGYSRLLGELRGGRFEKNLEARVATARFDMALKSFGPAGDDLDKAFGRKPGFPDLGGDNDPDALLAQAELELASIVTDKQGKEQFAKAEVLLRKAFGLDKKNVSVGMLLAEVLTALNKRDEGVRVLKQTAEALGAVDDKYLRVIDRLLDLGEQEVSAALVETKLAPDETKKPIVTYFRGRLAVLKPDWPVALALLDEIAPSLVRLPEYHKKAALGLAACYAAMQNPDKQLEFCRMARRDDPDYVPAVIGEAEALARMGKHAEALAQYRVIVNENRLTGYRTELARLELLDVLSQAGDVQARNWSRFEDSLGTPPEARAPEVRIYEADALVARGKGADATKLLRDWLAAHPKDAKASAVWVALARVQDGGKPEAAAAVLEEAEKAAGDTVELRLARAALLVVRAKPATPAEFDALAAGSETFPKPEQFRLLFGLGQVAARVADRGPEGEAAGALRTAALRLLRAAADVSPKDLTCRAVLLDQGLAAGRADVVDRAIKEMAAAEGENGPVATLGRIAIRLPEVKKLTDPAARAAGVRELRELAGRVRELRPGWSRAHIAIAQLDELEGLNDAALLSYRDAIRKGDRQEAVIRRTVDLYRTKQQDDQALGVLNELSSEVRLPDDLERYRSIRNMLAADLPKEGRATIDRIAPADGTDYRLVLLRGALLGAIREDAAALVAFLRAVELADTVPETWGALVAQLMKHGKLEEARRAVAEAEKKLTAAPTKPEGRAELELALGALHEMVGDPKAAFAHYAAARAAAPLELNPTRQLVVFFQRNGQPDKGIALLNAAKDSTAQDVARWARRHLAITLMGRTDAYTVRAEALALIESNLATAANDPEDLKARAYVWTADPVTREEGVRVLRSYGDRGDLTPVEYYLLGRLAFDQAKFVEAGEFFKKGARVRPGVTPEHLAAVVRVSLALNALGDAEAALGRLKTNYPTSWEAAREEARVLGHTINRRAARAGPEDAKKEAIAKLRDQARAVIVKYPGWDAVPNLAARTGPLFEELGLTADADAAYTKYLAGSDSPSSHAPLARFYIHQKQPDRAIALAREYEKRAPVLLTARIMTGAVASRRTDVATEAAVEKWLDGALRGAAGTPELEADLIGARAELLDAQGKSAESIAEYERALARGKSDLVVNNLCMLLALHDQKRAEEAVKMMSELIAIRGPDPRFLDTRAVAYLVSSRPAEAVKDLKMALVQYERASYRFHLAWAIDLDAVEGKRIFAADHLKIAKAAGLGADDLHPLEFKRYAELLVKYALDK